MKQNKGREKQELQKVKKECFEKENKKKHTVVKKKRKHWRNAMKWQEKEWDGLMQRMTGGRCPCHLRPQNKQLSMKDEKKEVN